MMTSISTKTVLTVAVLAGLSTSRICARRGADALGAEVRTWAMPTARTARRCPTRWAPTMPALLLKGAKKVPKGTLFFVGQNGQLYMRTGPYLEGDGRFMFGSN